MQGEAADSDSSGDSTAPDGSGDAQAVTLETFGPARQDAAAAVVKAYDASVIRQPSCGQVDLNYFADAAFLGDSLTVGFSDYQINLGGALVCGYTGVGPDAIVNRTAVKSSVRGEEIALDVLAAAQPKKLYILLGHQHPHHAGCFRPVPGLLRPDAGHAAGGAGAGLRDLCGVGPAGCVRKRPPRSRVLLPMCCAG